MTAIDSRPVFFFDIDNCHAMSTMRCRHSSVSPPSLDHVGNAMLTHLLICLDKFFVKHLTLNKDDAHMLHQKYYKEYGLAIEGLARHHKIDPLVFNYEVDDALPLDACLKPDPNLRKLLQSLDTSKVKPWLLTNAYINHAKRVVKLLDVEEFFEGVTFCDYGQLPLVCKPSQDMYAKAEKEAGAPSTESCFFVDDSHLNCKHAQDRGWTVVHLVEPGQPIPRIPASRYLISSLQELRTHFPHVFKPQAEEA
ncbi:hypothetical protein N7474_003442 [Penicillium riverlandense]|uniref:uncharacterized protein n=1 Tax=Penicillium riverlandense TaxID=1903569 RepID=UPI002548F306|nr:uncharacterized protein N7474_003442 [Penicillium riverlandense]KAJ5826304.1 hypothetical protein N7474_003442 [Penicillium riverlandense]